METNAPAPRPRHGTPPGVMVASLGALQGLVAKAATGSVPTQVYYHHNDHLGTPQVMTDETGAVVWRADYEPFGEANVVVGLIENEFRFPGQYRDAETGRHQNWHRDYAPGVGGMWRRIRLGWLEGLTATYMRSPGFIRTGIETMRRGWGGIGGGCDRADPRRPPLPLCAK